MARPARSVGRTIAVLNLLGANPGTRFSLTAIADRLAFNKATCHAMLMELASQGMVIRHPDKTYTLGSALVNLGRAATLDESAVLEIARRELVAIHDELNLSCVATRIRDGEIEVAARRDVQRPLIDYSPVGHRITLRPPDGQEFLAWAPRAEVERWLGRLPAEARAEQRGAYYERLESVRRVGYRASILDEVRALRRVLRRFGEFPGAGELLDEIETRAHGPFDVSDFEPHLAVVTRFKAPIFDPSGRVVLVLAISQFPPNVGLADVRAAVERLLEGTRRVTASLHGSEPVPDWATAPAPVASVAALRRQA
jgi:DNA-binding IclR family transcriptional regulator